MLTRRKGQSITIGIILSLTALLLFIGVSLITSSDAFERMYERAKGSHTLLLVSQHLHDYEKIMSWWEEQEPVEHVHLIRESEIIKINVNKNGKTEMDSFFLAEYNAQTEQNQLYTLEDELAAPLQAHEIYVNPVFANLFDVKKYDELDVLINNELVAFTVAGIVVDPQYSSMLSYSRNWIAEGVLDRYGIEHGATIGIRYTSYDAAIEETLIAEFEAYSAQDFPAQIMPFETLELIYSLLFTVISAALLLVSLLMLFIVIFIIRNTISNTIIDNYKSIGVMKATGFSNRQIKAIYVLMYGFLTGLASSFGIVIGYVLQGTIVEKLQEALNVPVTRELAIPGMVTLLLILGLVTVFSYIAARKATRIKPIQAIKYGLPEESVTTTRVGVKHLIKLPFSLIIALKQMANRSKQTIAIVASHALIIVLCISMVSILDSFRGQSIIEHFTSMPLGDMSITYHGEETVETMLLELKEMDDTKDVLYTSMIMDSSITGSDGKQVRVLGSMLLGHTEDFGVSVLKGRAPITDNEILVTTKTLDETGKSIGDYVEVHTALGAKKYLITGLYQTVNNLGLAYMITFSEEIANLEKNAMAYYTVRFSDTTNSYEEVKVTLLTRYSDTIDVKHLDDTSEGIKGMLDQLPAVFSLLIAIFYVVSGAAVMNWTSTDIKRSTKMFGLLKVSGLSNRQIMGSLVLKTMLITLTASVIGVSVALLFAPYFMEWLVSVTPFQITNLSLELSNLSAVLTVGCYYLVTLVATLLPAKKIKKITPRVLLID